MKRIPKIILVWLISLIVFLLIMFILSKIYINMPLYYLILGFISQNAMFLIVMSFFFMLSEVFYDMHMPFNLPAPLFGSVAAVMVTMFIIRMLIFMESILNVRAVSVLDFIYNFIYAIVFVVVMIAGYIRILSRKQNASFKRPKKANQE